ncbi:hypothetical protein [Leifsonia sp. 1010]|uniref:hypothetical protein n=1 Tax=Leifsonia sp. 1010 TaxID=2817769 RepID=UPI0028652BEB|nr:hypothetical protein [Leifsonia sp. 1010]MDR6611122.1 hypothetical protein [Leifsonia sp. 1010]
MRREADATAAAAALTTALRDAYLAGDASALAGVLGLEVHLVVDHGGTASPPVAVGIASCLPLLHGLLGDAASLRLDVRPMNGRSGLVASRDGRVFAVMVPHGAVGAVDHLWIVADPEKLRRWG